MHRTNDLLNLPRDHERLRVGRDGDRELSSSTFRPAPTPTRIESQEPTAHWMPADTARRKSFAGTRNVTRRGGLLQRQLSGRSGRHAHGHHHPVHRRCRLRRFGGTSEFSAAFVGTHAVKLTGFVATARTRPWISPGRRARDRQPRIQRVSVDLIRRPFRCASRPRSLPAWQLAAGRALFVPRRRRCTNRTTYFYRSEDVETTGRTRETRARARDAEGGRWPRPRRPRPWRLWLHGTAYGNPAATSFRILERTARYAARDVLRTAALYATPQRRRHPATSRCRSFQDVRARRAACRAARSGSRPWPAARVSSVSVRPADR